MIRLRWSRGFWRLGVVVYAVMYVLVALDHQRRYGNDRKWLWQQIDPLSGYAGIPHETDWCVIAASPKFLGRSDDERILLAEAHFETHARFWAEQLGQGDEYRRWFLKSATMTLADAPIKTWVDSAYPSYRAFPRDSLPQDSRLHSWFTPGIAIGALVFSAILTLVLMAATHVVVWLVRGFLPPEAGTS